MAILSTPGSFQLPSALIDPVDDQEEGNFATEILPAPPSLSSIKLPVKDSHLKKPVTTLSYLPSSDPGSSYTGGPGSLSGTLTTSAAGVDSGRRKRARLDKGPNGRTQRAATRNTYATSNTQPSSLLNQQELKFGEATSTVELSSHLLSPRGSSPELIDDLYHGKHENGDMMNSQSTLRPSRKGKGRERTDDEMKREPLEPTLSSSLSNEPLQPPLTNHDHCSACRSNGSLLYCDSCPMAFHLWCLNPPLDHSEVPGPDSAWHCPSCTQREHPRPHPSPSFLAALIYTAETSLPIEYSLPEDIRGHFKHVMAGPRGAYGDSSTVRAPRINRLGFAEDRDPYRLKDRNGEAILCFRCGKSTFPDDSLASNNLSQTRKADGTSLGRPKRAATMRGINYRQDSHDIDLRSMLSCDYCSLSWHLDCLSPPLTSMPPMTRKWMCPNHVQNTIKNRRIPKNGLDPIEVRQTRVFNNGTIEVIPSDDGRIRNTVAVDEVLINGRVYRVPERVVILDFWDRLRREAKPQHPQRNESPIEQESMSSPLTSLSSLDEDIPAMDSAVSNVESLIDLESMTVATILCDLASLGNLNTERQTEMVNDTATNREMANQSSPPISPLAIDASTAHGNQEAYQSRSSNRPRSPSSSSGLSSLHSCDLDELAPNGVSPLKIRIPKPLNIAVAAASAARNNLPLPRRSLRRSTSNYRSSSFRVEDSKEEEAALSKGTSQIDSLMELHTL